MKLKWPVQHAPVDRATIIAAQVGEGARCGNCLTLNIGVGCECRRWELYEAAVADAITWAEDSRAKLAVDPDKADAKAYAIVSGAVYRAARKYGQAVSPELRRFLRTEFGTKPTWHPPRVHEASHLPV